MVAHIRITLDDDRHEEVARVKEARGETWSEFVTSAAEELDNNE